jgi:uncharacterized lipoprotein YehR (DUF1307 family)
MALTAVSPSLFEDMYMNKVLVAGILGLMLTACGQKEEAAAPAATPAADVAATVEKAASDASATVEKAASEASATVEKAAEDVATKVDAAVSDAKAN